MTEEIDVAQGDNEITTLSIEERLVRLERISLRYRSLLDEGDSLSDSVLKLSMTADTLAASLAQVDKNQKILMGIRSDVDDIKEANPRSRIEAETESTRLDDQSRRVKTIVFGASIISTVIIIMVGVGFVVYTKVRNSADAKTDALSILVCHERGKQADSMRTFIKTWEANVMANPMTGVKYKAEMTIAYKKMLDGYAPVDCSVLNDGG